MKLTWNKGLLACSFVTRVGPIGLEVGPNDRDDNWGAMAGKRVRADLPSAEAAQEWAEAEIVQIVREMAFTLGLNISN